MRHVASSAASERASLGVQTQAQPSMNARVPIFAVIAILGQDPNGWDGTILIIIVHEKGPHFQLWMGPLPSAPSWVVVNNFKNFSNFSPVPFFLLPPLILAQSSARAHRAWRMPVCRSYLLNTNCLSFVAKRPTGFVFLLLLTTSGGRTYVKRSRNTKPVDLKTTKSSSLCWEGKNGRRAFSKPAENRA